jgi:uncharacterized protein YyaL (SSP411 family)
MTNRLAREVSPYLLQHSGNPVDWYPWGREALDKARNEDKPILLSIGYSACHWCHVMERESFESEAVARRMNDLFVNVKVDREERPDLDHVYQLVVQLMGRSGGWPLTVFLTPDERPFFGGTYFPPDDRHGLPAFPKVLEAVSEAYRSRRSEVESHARELFRAIEQATAVDSTATPVTIERAAAATQKIALRFDPVHGGFGHRPKFPNTSCLDVLLRAGDRERVKKALDAMRAGGIWDHLGGGFHRYSTDERWLVPHFEKMLYDNAQLLRLYVDGWRFFGDLEYEKTARDIAQYVGREMTSAEGAFYATQDADSEGHEGRYFVWTPQEVDDACGDDTQAAQAAKFAFGITARGNFEGSGATVLSRCAGPREVASALGVDDAAALAAVERARSLMLAARERRVKPFRDEKILAGWNGLMAGALADAGAAFGDDSMIAAARRSLSFVERVLVAPEDGGRARIQRLCKDGVVRGPGFLDDHAFVGNAAFDLYEATGEPHWVRFAQSLAEAILAHFHDATGEGFFFTPDDGPPILVRAKDPYDHAVPSGASVACKLLLRLGALTNARYAAPAERAIANLARTAVESPLSLAVTVALMDRLVRGTVDVVLAGPPASPTTRALANVAHRTYLPDRTLAWANPSDPESLEACQVLWEGKAAEAEPTAYVCRGRTCSLPLRDPQALARSLAE